MQRRLLTLLMVLALVCAIAGQSSGQSSSQQSSSRAKSHLSKPDAGLDPGAISNGVYRDKSLALSVKIPAGWVLRTDEMNARDDSEEKSSPQGAQSGTGSAEPGRVLLAAFSRPPDAKASDINASILIVAESAASYPGLKEAAQYFYPLTEVAKGQGFTADEDPYEYVIGPKTVVRGDFHKNVGSRVMRQSTLALLARGYAISITVIGGAEEEVEDLIDGVSFGAAAK